VAWARDRFGVELDAEALRGKQRDEIRDVLLVHSRTNQSRAQQALAEVHVRVERLFSGHGGAAAGGNGALESLADWLKEQFNSDVSAGELQGLDRDTLTRRLEMEVENRFRPEIRKLERMLVLDILDETWKNHLLTMDHLRSSIGLRGYAQVDPKVEYKREGMRAFERMWASVEEQITTLIFKMENLDESFVRHTFVERAAIHEDAASAAQLAAQESANQAGAADARLEPIRRHGPRVGRNDPCPCGSGKKYKQCCLRKGGAAA
jgi:preprotein translocase subunit SecA